MSPPDTPPPRQTTPDGLVLFRNEHYDVTVTERQAIVGHRTLSIADVEFCEVVCSRSIFGGLFAGAVGGLMVASASVASILGMLLLIYTWISLFARECYRIDLKCRGKMHSNLFEREKPSRWRPYHDRDHHYPKAVAREIADSINSAAAGYRQWTLTLDAP